MEMGGKEAYKCFQCGKCMSTCPWAQIDTVTLPVYRMPQNVKLGISVSSEDKNELAREVEEVFRCVGCEACVSQCPKGVNIPNILRAIRRILGEYGSCPEVLKPVISTLRASGNPLGQPHEKRNEWAKDLEISKFDNQMEFLYFPCCFPCYDTRTQKVAQSTAKVLKKANVLFGILGAEEWCCGEAVRKMGFEKLFTELATSNIIAFQSAGVRKIITTSPHCYNTFKKEYTELLKIPQYTGQQAGEGKDVRPRFEIYHTTQLFDMLIQEGKIIPQKQLNKKVVYHDACNLGRINGIYDEPRKIITSIPGVELIEVPNFSHEYSLCCGGGSGGLWIDWPKEERMANVRVKQAIDAGAEILAVACPYCLQMFEDSVKVMDIELEVKDISELLADALSD